ncbi:MAG: hypothetical protein KDJ47_03775 [Hyphomicrobiaceae bacterium]|nr:hypothetical protein [Hyphomicrobiaceae bacterium]
MGRHATASKNERARPGRDDALELPACATARDCVFVLHGPRFLPWNHWATFVVLVS